MGIPKMSRLDKNTAFPLLNGYFDLFERFFKIGSGPHSAELEKYLSSELHMRSNGKILCRNLKEYIIYMDDVKKKYETIKLSEFLEEPVLGGNKIVIRYDMEGTIRGKPKREWNVMAIVTIDEDSKILQWSEVVNESKV
jgi:hypothetical protein